MDIRIFLYLTITSLIKTSPGNACTIENEGFCLYTVNCENPAVINAVPYCEYMDPYITLIISKSPDHIITANLFNTKFNPLVRIMSAIGNIWTDILDFAFSNFKKVLYIDLSGNNIKNLGSAFRGLEELDSLNLSRNQLEVINPGTFKISDIKNRLYLLDLSNNMLKFLSKEMFIHLYNLRKLYLQGNYMIKLQYEHSKYLKNLDYLNLCCSNLRMLNITMKYLKSLRQLNLSFNNVKTINVSELISLEVINLSHNEIQEFDFGNFEHAAYLLNVDLSYNKMKNIACSKKIHEFNYTYYYEKDVNKPLIKIDLRNNNISHVDRTFFHIFSHISYLNLSNNVITKFDQGTFKHVKILKSLYLSNCKLNITDETFKGLKTTEEIYLRNNNLTILDATFFSDCVGLKRIAADNNEIKNVDIQKFMKLVPSLSRITLKGNPDAGAPFDVNWVINKIMGVVTGIGYAILIVLVLVGIKLIFLYVRVYRRVIIVYAIKCGRCILLRYRFIK